MNVDAKRYSCIWVDLVVYIVYMLGSGKSAKFNPTANRMVILEYYKMSRLCIIQVKMTKEYMQTMHGEKTKTRFLPNTPLLSRSHREILTTQTQRYENISICQYILSSCKTTQTGYIDDYVLPSLPLFSYSKSCTAKTN